MQCISCGRSVPTGSRFCETCTAENELQNRSRAETGAVEAGYDRKLVGVRGWLALFCAGTGFFGPLGLVQLIPELRQEILQHSAEDPSLPLVGSILIGLVLLIIAGSVTVAFALISLKPWAPRAAKIFLVAVPTIAWVMVLGSAALSSIGGEAAGWELNSAPPLVLSTISSGVWFGYFSVSRRVKMTYSKTTS